MDALEPALARRSQSGADLRGMMAVVIDHAYAAGPAFVLEAAIDAGKVLQAFADAVRGNIQPDAHSHRGRGVEHVVVPRNLQMEFPQRSSVVLDGKMGVMLVAGTLDGAVGNMEVRAFAATVGDGAASQPWQ